MANHDWDEMDRMLTIVDHQVTDSLTRMTQTQRCFDRTFKGIFIQAVNDRLVKLILSYGESSLATLAIKILSNPIVDLISQIVYIRGLFQSCISVF